MLSLLSISESPEPRGWAQGLSQSRHPACSWSQYTKFSFPTLLSTPAPLRTVGGSGPRTQLPALPGHDPFSPSSLTHTERQAAEGQQGPKRRHRPEQAAGALARWSRGPGAQRLSASPGLRTWRPGPSLGAPRPHLRRPIPGLLAGYLHTPAPSTPPRGVQEARTAPVRPSPRLYRSAYCVQRLGRRFHSVSRLIRPGGDGKTAPL